MNAAPRALGARLHHREPLHACFTPVTWLLAWIAGSKEPITSTSTLCAPRPRASTSAAEYARQRASSLSNRSMTESSCVLARVLVNASAGESYVLPSSASAVDLRSQ